jgi:hypothetical protein
MMKAMNGVAKNKHGMYYVRVRVPKGLEEATAQHLGNGKPRQVFLKRTLATKDLREANIRAKPVLMEFDRIIAQAESIAAERPLRTSLEKHEIEQIAAFLYAHELMADDEDRNAGGSEALFQDVARQLEQAGIEHDSPFHIGDVPEFGLSDREMSKRAETTATVLPVARSGLGAAHRPGRCATARDARRFRQADRRRYREVGQGDPRRQHQAGMTSKYSITFPRMAHQPRTSTAGRTAAGLYTASVKLGGAGLPAVSQATMRLEGNPSFSRRPGDLTATNGTRGEQRLPEARPRRLGPRKTREPGRAECLARFVGSPVIRFGRRAPPHQRARRRLTSESPTGVVSHSRC